jgi:hypothetical protein
MRAQDGANTGPFSDTLKFSVVTPVTNRRTGLGLPAHGETVDANPPTLIFANADVTGPAAGIKYLLQIATDQAFTHIVFSETGSPQSNQTRVTPARRSWPDDDVLLACARIRPATSPGHGRPTGSFKTPVGTSEPPPPPPPPPGGGWWWRQPGQLREPRRSLHRGLHLRQVRVVPSRGCQRWHTPVEHGVPAQPIIEAGICGGLDLGWNLKRGGPDLSDDFIVDRRGGQEIGVDHRARLRQHRQSTGADMGRGWPGLALQGVLAASVV